MRFLGISAILLILSLSAHSMDDGLRALERQYEVNPNNPAPLVAALARAGNLKKLLQVFFKRMKGSHNLNEFEAFKLFGLEVTQNNEYRHGFIQVAFDNAFKAAFRELVLENDPDVFSFFEPSQQAEAPVRILEIKESLVLTLIGKQFWAIASNANKDEEVLDEVRAASNYREAILKAFAFEKTYALLREALKEPENQFLVNAHEIPDLNFLSRLKGKAAILEAEGYVFDVERNEWISPRKLPSRETLVARITAATREVVPRSIFRLFTDSCVQALREAML